MLRFRGAILSLVATAFFPAASAVAAKSKNTTAILVDKKTNQLHVVEYEGGRYKKILSYHATLGRVVGDKEMEGDLKTPEGIYTASRVRMSPGPKFGKMAFHLDYPNTFDQLAGRTGSAIMLHATDWPERLKQNYDSEGCVVVKNEEIVQIQPHIRIGLTPFIIFPELTDEYMSPGEHPGLKSFFDSWIRAWETESIDAYINHYHSDFSAQGRDRDAWKKYKASLNEKYASIEIGPEDVRFYRHPKYSVITFTQNYRSKLRDSRGKRKDLGWGHRSRGTKILYVAEEDGKPKIIAETFTHLMW